MAWTISAVARTARLSPDVIRTWERRYKLVEPDRDANGVRLYSEGDVGRLTLAGEAARRGHRIARIAKLSDPEIEELIARKPLGAQAHADVVGRLLDALHANNLPAASQILRRAALLMPAGELVLDILAPTLREIGREWENGELAIWQEHLLSNQMLDVLVPLQEFPSGDVRIVFATPPFERHGFGIKFAALLAAGRGVGGCNLGVAVPASELVEAARRLHAQAVVVGMTQEGLPEAEADDYARELDAGLPSSVALAIGGAGGLRVAASMRSQRVQGVATLEAFDALCERWR